MMTDYYAESSKYTYLWNKYRPAILKLMVDTKKSPQQYKFSDHEFKAAHPTEKGGYSFTLRVFKNTAMNDIKKSGVAKGLLRMLQQSKKATELSETSVFEFVMNREFQLSINREKVIKITEIDDMDQPQFPFKPASRMKMIL